jgi:hypothetical protein
MKYLTIAAVLALAACSSPTEPTRAFPRAPSLEAGGSTAPADKGSCGPKDDINNGNEKHCAPGTSPGSSNSPGNS